MILCISVLSVVISPFSFLILLIWFFSLFFLMSQANGFSISFIFSKNQLLVLLIFAIVSFVSFSFISALIFIISFLLLAPGSSFLLFLVALGVKLGYIFDFSLVSWHKRVLLWTFPLTLFLLNPIDFGLLWFFFFHLFLYIFLFPFFISSMICWWLRSVLFSLHMLVFLILFSPVVDI